MRNTIKSLIPLIVAAALAVFLLLIVTGIISFKDYEIISIGPDEIKCLEDSDCVKISNRCCSSCGSGIYVNKYAAEKIELARPIKCFFIFCDIDYSCGAGNMFIRYEPACIENQCTSREVLRCDTICTDLKKLKEYNDRLNITTQPYLEEKLNECNCTSSK